MALGDLRHKGILFGCDSWARVIEETHPYQKKGVLMIQYLILPTEELKEAYPNILQRPGALPVQTKWGPCKWVEYPKHWVEDENRSRRNAIVRVLCTFDGRRTNHTDREERLTKELKRYQEENEMLKLASVVDAEEKEIILKEKIKQAEMFAELNDKMKGEIKGGKKDKDEEDS